MRVTGQKSSRVMLAGVVVIATGMLFSIVERLEVRTVSDAPFGSARLVSIAQLSEYTEMCLPEEMETGHSNLVADNLFAAFKDEPVYASSQDAGQTVTVARPPVRNILDTDPIYSAVAVDVQHDEVFLQDTNTWSIRVFNRLDNTPANAPRTEPKRVIGGENTDIQFNSCIYIDPKNGDIYTVEKRYRRQHCRVFARRERQCRAYSQAECDASGLAGPCMVLHSTTSTMKSW